MTAPPTTPITARTATARVLVAPVTVTPTKPLTPSHLKGLFWTDALVRATTVLAEVTYRYSHTAFDTCEQTVGFWEYLDRTEGERDYSGHTEEEIGDLYMRYRADPDRAPFPACVPYLDAVESHGWVHPASARLLEIWTAQYRALGLQDPGLTRCQRPGLSLPELIDLLAARDLCLDQRAHGGPVYLDVTSAGLPLRRIVAADGRPNYLMCALRDLVPLAERHDEVVLIYDIGLETDYTLLTRVLERLGAVVHRIPLGRVPIDGRVVSARDGGWRGITAGALLSEYGDRPAEVLRLGLRLYFVALLGPGDRQSFRRDLLDRCLRRAERLLGTAVPADPADLLRRLDAARGGRDPHHYVDPYRLTSGLLGRGGLVSRALLQEVYL